MISLQAVVSSEDAVRGRFFLLLTSLDCCPGFGCGLVLIYIRGTISTSASGGTFADGGGGQRTAEWN